MSFEFKLPELGENITKATIVGVLVSAGDPIQPGQAVLELETDKAVLEVPSDVGGTVTAVHVKSGQEIGIGQLLFTLEPAPAQPAAEAAAASTPAPAAPAPAAPAPAPAPQPPAPEPAASGEAAAAAPSVRRFARELGVEVAEVPGSGPALARTEP